MLVVQKEVLQDILLEKLRQKTVVAVVVVVVALRLMQYDVVS